MSLPLSCTVTNPRVGILLVNLGTPNSHKPSDVFHYLNEFLTDKRVLDFNWFKRQLLVRGFIVPLRYRNSAKLYRQLWTGEGAPLLIHGKAVTAKLQDALGEQYKVVLAMRYQNPSIPDGLEELIKAQVEEIIVFPLFPQYSSSTTGSVHQKVMESVKNSEVIPNMRFVNSYPDHPSLIDAFCDRVSQYTLAKYDHILFSFHGLPVRYLQKGNPSGVCSTENCCKNLNKNNQFCYKAQCFATAKALIERLALKEGDFTICFQSRLGKEPWISPYTSDILKIRAEKGDKNILVLCPAFVCDCLETTCEITHEYGKEFKDRGGEALQLVEGLNSHPTWISALKTMILEQTSKCFNK